jgi:tripartite-type tricarboxylate transporter receptor subunit TctC
MRILPAVLALALACGATPGTSAQSYPSRTVTMVVPFAAGGPTDTIALILAEGMRKHLGKGVVVENVPGAAGSVGVGRVAQAPADGYTIGIGHWSTHVLNGAIYALPYDLLTDLTPIAMLASNPQVIVGKKALPAKDLGELLAWLRANSDRALQGTAGTGSPSHVAGVHFQNSTGTRFQFVPYRGGAPVMQALLAGRLDFGFEQAANVLPHVLAGAIRAYAVTAKSRLPAAPEIPTIDEAGLPGFYIDVWHGLWAPRGVPRNIVVSLNAAVAAALSDADIHRRLTELGQDIPPAGGQTPEALALHQRAEIEKWWPIIKRASIRVE